jgi:hypothetical protein
MAAIIQSYTVDSRLPVPTGITPNDPTHPANLVRNMIMMQNQAVADSMYDPYPPKRIDPNKKEGNVIENFETRNRGLELLKFIGFAVGWMIIFYIFSEILFYIVTKLLKSRFGHIFYVVAIIIGLFSMYRQLRHTILKDYLI